MRGPLPYSSTENGIQARRRRLGHSEGRTDPNSESQSGVAALNGAISYLAAASAASTARTGGGFPFDPASTLSWSVPLILVGPLTVALMIALGIRTRRPAANLALAAPLVALLACGLALWARFAKDDPYDASFEWINVATAFSGPSQFQSFTTAVGIRVSHLTLTLALAAIVISAGVMLWSRAGTRRQPAPGRFFALQALLLAATLGVVVATDLVQLFVFWAVAGASSYLLLTHMWGEEESTRGARLALALPAIADMSLLAGIAILYSRYGQLNVDQLIPTLAHTAGAGPRALAAACVLIFIGAGGRLGLFPLQGWLTRTGASPPGAQAAVQGLWPVMVAALLVKVMPILITAISLPLQVVAVTAALSALALPLLALATNDARRVVTAAGIGLSALAVLAFVRPSAVAPAALLLTVTGLCRAAAVLATGMLVVASRSAELTDLGEGYRRQRVAAVTLALAGAGLALGTGEVAGENLRPAWAAVYGLGLLLGMLALFRLYFIAGHGPLRRRRGFDPERVRPPASALAFPPLLLALVGVLLALAMFAGRWLTFVDHRPHAGRSALATLVWLVVPLLGLALASLLFLGRREVGDRLANLAGRGLGLPGRAVAQAQRRLVEPTLQLTEVAEERLLAGGERTVGNAFSAAARLVRFPFAARFSLLGGGLALLLIAAAALYAAGGRW